jgi:hypothetical protein
VGKLAASAVRQVDEKPNGHDLLLRWLYQAGELGHPVGSAFEPAG